MSDLANSKSSTDLDEAGTQAYRLEQIRRLFGQLHLIYLADVVAGTFLFGILFSSTSSAYTYTWYSLLVVSTVLRAAIAREHKRAGLSASNQHQCWRFLFFGAMWSGTIWGFAWTLLPPQPSFLQLAAVGLWLAGMLAGAATTMALMKEVFLAFAIPSSLVFILYNVISYQNENFILAGGFLIYLGFITPIALRIGNDFNRSIVLQTRNSILQEDLTQEAKLLAKKQHELDQLTKRAVAAENEKKIADEAFKAVTEERLLILDAVGEGIFGVNNRGNITFINSPALKLLNMTESELINQSALPLISSNNQESSTNAEAYIAITQCFQKGTAVFNLDGFLHAKDLTEIPIRFSCTPIRKKMEVVGSVVSFVDVSAQKEMEARLFQSQKMEAIGRLTGGVAHDFNNLLTVIMGNLQFLKKRLATDEKAASLAERVMQAAKSGAELNSRLLSFSREQALIREAVNIAELLNDMSEFMDRLVGEDVSLSVNINNNDELVYVDKTQLQNALLNLCVNSKDAMSSGGKVLIEVNLISTNLNSTKAEEFVEIAFTDTGCGIPAAIQEKIFEPFFTTKDKNQGTGLGLSSVYGFIRQSGGSITVESEENKGTTFKLLLPVSYNHKPKKPDNEVEKQNPQENFSGSVLIVEDDIGVKEVAVQMLKDSGYSVLTASNAKLGFEVFQSHPEIQLVFSDVIMPGGMSGIEMSQQMLELRPDIPILLATGYADKTSKEKILEHKGVQIVSKPYDITELPSRIFKMIK